MQDQIVQDLRKRKEGDWNRIEPELALIRYPISSMWKSGLHGNLGLIIVPSDGFSFKGTRTVAVRMAAVLVMGYSLFTGIRNSIQEFKFVFNNSPHQIVPRAVLSQVDIFRHLVPKGSFVIYLMNPPNAWWFGLWKRALFPDYTLLPLDSAAAFDSAWVRAFRVRHHVRFVILAGTSLPSMGQQLILPKDSNGPVTALAELRD